MFATCRLPTRSQECVCINMCIDLKPHLQHGSSSYTHAYYTSLERYILHCAPACAVLNWSEIENSTEKLRPKAWNFWRKSWKLHECATCAWREIISRISCTRVLNLVCRRLYLSREVPYLGIGGQKTYSCKNPTAVLEKCWPHYIAKFSTAVQLYHHAYITVRLVISGGSLGGPLWPKMRTEGNFPGGFSGRKSIGFKKKSPPTYV
jgi:hypothetical protein